MRRRLLLAGLAGLLATGCSATVAGTGSYAAGDRADPTPARPSPSGARTRPASPRPDPAGRTSLSCSGGTVVSPTGAPYCYLVPAGFTDVTSSVRVDASVGDEKYRTAVAVADRDLLIVTVYELRVDTDAIPSGQLASELKGVLGQLTEQGFAFESTTPKRSAVDGARAFGYHAREARNRLEADVFFVFRGKTEVEVNCQWRDRPAEVQQACRQLLGSLQVTGGR